MMAIRRHPLVLSSDEESSEDELSYTLTQMTSPRVSSSRKTEQTGLDQQLRSLRVNSPWSFSKDSDEYALDAKLILHKDLYEQLFPFQVEGLEWIHNLFLYKPGGILADDMGMGKTYMTCAHIGGLLQTRSIQKVLIVSPKSVMLSWMATVEKLVKRLCSCRHVQVYMHESGKSKLKLLQKLSDSCIVIVGYESLKSAESVFAGCKWDYMVLDEGHTIKNPGTANHVTCQRVAREGTFRLLLSGTPLMNNLVELWALIDFVTKGSVLGEKKEFVSEFQNPILASREKNATNSALDLGRKKLKECQDLLRPYLLQRSKEEYLTDQLPPKTEMVAWVHMTKRQRVVYKTFLETSKQFREIQRGNFGNNVLPCINGLKLICNHAELAPDDSSATVKDKKSYNDYQTEILANGSGKLQCALSMILRFSKAGHCTLVFADSLQLLNIFDRLLSLQGVRVARLHGEVSITSRQDIVDQVNSGRNLYDAVLITTKTGAVGLTLTGADRVIILSPDWNPAIDSQAVDRCYRIGQKNPVISYRIITAGTVEEKIYARQAFKDGLCRSVTNEQDVARHFDQSELAALFDLENPGVCETMAKIDACTKGMDFNWKPHEFLKSNCSVLGVSRHDGFYLRQENQSETPTAAFGGSPTPKKMGKARRVLAKAEVMKQTNHIPEDLVLKPKNKHSTKKIPTDQQLASRGKLQHALELYHNNNRPRAALNMLMEIVKQGEIHADDERLLHRSIAMISGKLGLL